MDGIFLRLLTGESRTGRNVPRPRIAPIQIVVWTPTTSDSPAPMSEPIGIVPQTRNRIVAFIRPRKASGVIACRRLTWFTL